MRLTVLACAIGGTLTLGAVNAQAQSTMTCAPVTQQEIAALFERWNASLATHEADKVTANYAPDAVLLPTVSNRPRTDTASIRDYFVHFLERNPQGTIDSRTIRIGCNTASDVGTYTFKLSGKPPGTTETVKARYTSTNCGTENGSSFTTTLRRCPNPSSRRSIQGRINRLVLPAA